MENTMTGIVDYNAGNIKSVERALAFLDAPYVLSKNPKDLEKCDRIVFPVWGRRNTPWSSFPLRASTDF